MGKAISDQNSYFDKYTLIDDYKSASSIVIIVSIYEKESEAKA